VHSEKRKFLIELGVEGNERKYNGHIGGWWGGRGGGRGGEESFIPRVELFLDLDK